MERNTEFIDVVVETARDMSNGLKPMERDFLLAKVDGRIPHDMPWPEFVKLQRGGYWQIAWWVNPGARYYLHAWTVADLLDDIAKLGDVHVSIRRMN